VKVITLNIILNDEMVWASRDAKMEREREREREREGAGLKSSQLFSQQCFNEN